MSQENCSNGHDCPSLLRRVMLSLDGQMSEQEEKDFLDEINNCSYCLDKYSIEKTFKDFLCDKLSRKSVSEETIKSIRDKVLGFAAK